MTHQISFILVEPGLPENVGAVARAMKTMGLRDLRLIRPCDHLGKRARWMAHGSNEILEEAKVYSGLNSALADIDLSIASTVRPRHSDDPMIPCHHLVSFIQNKGEAVTNVAMIFGREDSGLTNLELELCDVISTIPLHTNYPSLNLAQAAMIYAYLLSSEIKPLKEISSFPAGQIHFRVLKEKVRMLSAHIGIDNTELIEKRLSMLSEKDMNLLHFVLNRWNQYIHPEENDYDPF